MYCILRCIWMSRVEQYHFDSDCNGLCCHAVADEKYLDWSLYYVCGHSYRKQVFKPYLKSRKQLYTSPLLTYEDGTEDADFNHSFHPFLT